MIEREDCLRTPDSSRHAINCAITAWQLHDWVYAEKHKYEFMSQFKYKAEFRNFLYSKCDFRTLHDLADGVKHFELTSRTTTIKGTKTSSWSQLSRYRKDIIKPQLFLTTKFGAGGLTMSFNDLLNVITHFWYYFFRDQLNEDIDQRFENFTGF